MANVRTSVPGSGYGNVYVDALIWGGIAWDPAGGPIKVYFGQPEDFYAASAAHGPSDILWNGNGAMRWAGSEVQAFAYATSLYSSVCKLTFAAASSVADADIVWWKTPIDDETLGAHETPTGKQIWGYFNSTFQDTWTTLSFGGDGLNTIIHELGHGVGLAHPHDGGTRDDATTFPGTYSAFGKGSLGLNQGIWTVMSYNPGWDKAPTKLSYGAQGGLGAFDIAALQALYGANETTAQGDNVYELPTQNRRGTGWSCIWDTGGTDTISATRAKGDLVIDLRAATLRNGDPHAAGFVSHLDKVSGGYTIANGVTIENAFGGAGDDRLYGNAAANLLRGSSGDDTLRGGSGDDNLQGSTGADVLYADDGDDVLWGGAGNDILRGGAGQDTFVFNTKPSASANRDKIADFNVTYDTIRLENAVFTKLKQVGQLAQEAFWVGSKAHDRDDRVIYDPRKGVLYYDPDGSKAGHAVVIATLQKHLKMSAGDFLVT